MPESAPKEVISKEGALKAPSVPTPAKPKFTFVKNLNPGEPTVPGVEFHRPVDRTGFRLSHGVFETTDEEVATALREHAKANPSKYIFEATVKPVVKE